MDKSFIFCAGRTQAAKYAADYLSALGLPVCFQPHENPGHLLLDVPSFEASGSLRMGGSFPDLLKEVPPDVTVYGGNLTHSTLHNYRIVDFLKDPIYLAENAYITAECALDVLLPYLEVTIRHCPILIIGWGRIGKCLGKLLQAMGAEVTVAARKETDRAMLHALGFHAEIPTRVADALGHYRVIFNTVPAPVFGREQMAGCHPNCIKIELASQNGLEADDIVIARGLPGIHMPESSGKLIAETFIRYYQQEAKP